jgi:hypothetical protein
MNATSNSQLLYLRGAHFAAFIHDIYSDGLLCDHVPPAQSLVGYGFWPDAENWARTFIYALARSFYRVLQILESNGSVEETQQMCSNLIAV